MPWTIRTRTQARPLLVSIAAVVGLSCRSPSAGPVAAEVDAEADASVIVTCASGAVFPDSLGLPGSPACAACLDQLCPAYDPACADPGGSCGGYIQCVCDCAPDAGGCAESCGASAACQGCLGATASCIIRQCAGPCGISDSGGWPGDSSVLDACTALGACCHGLRDASVALECSLAIGASMGASCGEQLDAYREAGVCP